MPSLELMIAFFAATAVFAYVPGPAMLYATAQTIARGRMSGLMAALGIHIGGYAHVVAAAAGLSALFHAVPVLYVVTKIAGAAYLVWLGVKMFIRKTANPTAAPVIEPKSARKAFAESIAVEVLNPKTAIFFLAFLPQFTDPAGALPIWGQLLVLGAIVNLTFSTADLCCVAMAGAALKRLNASARAQKLLRRLGGGLLVGLGVNLVLQRH
ncbi:MAG: LysE family translocator [Maricaulaceae bacterium]|jgi:threonine/homoserine/homoserine lactone efflux protein